MGRHRINEGESRHGKHAPDVFRIALYLTAEEKAVAILTAERQGRTLSDVLRAGIVSEATRCGILVNGSVSEKYQNRVNAYRQVLEAEKSVSKREVAK